MALEKELYDHSLPVPKRFEVMQLYLLAFYHRGLEETFLQHYDDSIMSLKVFSILAEHGLGADDPFNVKAQQMAADAIQKAESLRSAKLRLTLGFQEEQHQKKSITLLAALLTEDKLRQFGHIIPPQHKYVKPEETTKDMQLPSTERKDMMVKELRVINSKLLQELGDLCDKYKEAAHRAKQGYSEAIQELAVYKGIQNAMSLPGHHVVLNKILEPLFYEVLEDRKCPFRILCSFLMFKIIKIQAWARMLVVKQHQNRYRKLTRVRLAISGKKFMNKVGDSAELTQAYFMYSISLNIPEQIWRTNFSKPPSINYKVWHLQKLMGPKKEKMWSLSLPITEVLSKSKNEKLIGYWRTESKKIALEYLSSLMFVDGDIAFENASKLDQIYRHTLRMEDLEISDIDSSEGSPKLHGIKKEAKKRQSVLFPQARTDKTVIFHSNPPPKTPAAKNQVNLAGSSSFSKALPLTGKTKSKNALGRQLKTFETLIQQSSLTIQRWVRGHQARKRFRALWSVSSVPKLTKEFIQEGESFYLVVMKRLYSKELAFYCWNMTTQEIYEPLLVSAGHYDLLKPDTYLERLFVNIDECKMYFRDFWDTKNADRRDYLENFREYEVAERRMHLNTKNSRYRKRYFRENKEMRLIGKATREIGGGCYLQLTYIKYATGTCKISLFSKRTNDFVYVKYFYLDCKTVKELIDFAREKFLDCTIRAKSMQGGRLCFIQSRTSLSSSPRANWFRTKSFSPMCA